jgi:hypothetical protein
MLGGCTHVVWGAQKEHWKMELTQKRNTKNIIQKKTKGTIRETSRNFQKLPEKQSAQFNKEKRAVCLLR